MADQVPTRTRSLVERLFDPTIKQVATRGQAVVAAAGDAAEIASSRAATAWNDAEPIRREAARAGREALGWGRLRWRNDVQPGIGRLWSSRTAAIGAAGAAVPVAKELFDDAAVRLGIRRKREERHWGAFFVGMLVGAAAGIVAAMLTAPKPGREMRDELATTARGAAKDAAVRARDVATKARDVAATAGEWVPIFQRPDVEAESNGEPPVEEESSTPQVISRKRAATPPPVEETEQPA